MQATLTGTRAPLVHDGSDALVIDGLVKHYPHPNGGTFAAVDGVDLRVGPGEVFGILGPNGAGKTTTLEIVEGLTQADAGTVEVLGFNPETQRREVQRRIGVQLQSSAYFEYLRLGELLELFGGFYPRRLDADDLLARVGLNEKRNALVGELSGGQAQRFSIVAALVNDPEIVFLDEPTTGLDPQARRNVWSVIRGLSDEGRTVILTTHYMEEAEALADRVAVIDRGRIAAVDTPLALVDAHGSGTRVTFATPVEVARDELEALPAVSAVRSRLNGAITHELAVEAADVAVPALYQWAATAAVELRDVSIRRSTLEDVFLNLTGSRLRD
jgi:ABC-2 type transport system ATP-binding protein